MTHGSPGNLICPAIDLFDGASVRAALDAALVDVTAPGDIRKATVAILAAARSKGRDAIAAAFLEDPIPGRRGTRSYAWQTDQVVREVLYVAQTYLHPNHNPTEAERLSVMAVGGYGRGEMAAHSDVDLLFLNPYKITPWAESLIESMLYILWDLKLKVGHASRTIKDCLRLGRDDFTIRTSLVEHRYIAGDQALADELSKRLWSDLFQGTAQEFIDAKLSERAQRHRKQGGQRYMVEPNVKEGKGGLRDLQSLFWIGKYVHGTQNAKELIDQGVYTYDEFKQFKTAEDFLWSIRCHLHIIAGRAADQLTFDLQVIVAERLGYSDHGGRRAVEHFMQDYFRHATGVGELTRIFLTALEADHTKPEPMLTRLLKRRKSVREPYAVAQNRLTVADEQAFFADKNNMLGIVEEALRTGLLIHPDAMRLMSSHIELIDQEMRDDPKAQKLFLDILLKHGNPERGLRRMNELGVLAAFIPEFAPIVAMMQFNMYHHYTVDEHTIQCISHLSQIERGELVEELPIASGILNAGVNRRVLYVALLLHDIGKGRSEDHSALGAQIARVVAPRLGLKKKEAETVEWLVRNHLLLSDVAQKRDVSEPRTIEGFAKAVKSVERLDLLTVLTVCDIRGVGPGTWNNWKAMLIRKLYAVTRDALENGLEDLNRETMETEAKRALRAAFPDWSAGALRKEVGRHYGPYWQGLPPSTHVVFAKMLSEVEDDQIGIDVMLDQERDATRVCFAMVDHPGLVSRMTGALALVGANIVDARTYTTKDGYATAAYWIQDADGHPFEESRLPRLQKMITRTLKGEVVAREAFKDRDKIKKRERDFKVPTVITFDNEGSEIYTIVEVDTRDRPGLLYDLTRCLAENHVYVASAVIATYGEQVVDTFYVKDMTGLKFTQKARRERLEGKLLDAIVQGVRRAEV
ncbi:MAG: [protein-PII] uridylyltransferase [Pseudomonadota bacterium]